MCRTAPRDKIMNCFEQFIIPPTHPHDSSLHKSNSGIYPAQLQMISTFKWILINCLNLIQISFEAKVNSNPPLLFRDSQSLLSIYVFLFTQSVK